MKYEINEDTFDSLALIKEKLETELQRLKRLEREDKDNEEVIFGLAFRLEHLIDDFNDVLYNVEE